MNQRAMTAPGLLLRPGIDHDPVKPWNWATLPLRGEPVEIVSYPCPVTETLFVRMTIGDPTTIREVPVRMVAAFSPSRHELFYELRERNS